MGQDEREIAHWEARTTDTEKAAIELAMCLDALDNLAELWDTVSDEDRQQMARMLVEYIIYDFDRQQIVGRLSLEPQVTAATWQIDRTIPEG